ncbi:MAG: hypothetical protein IPM23_01165 [Candidatus Melainabacteria bacterium]|nr:hypothetical protein [Candidatus Melainabacteria bacterium]
MNAKQLNRTSVSLRLAAAAALVALVFSGLQMIAGTLVSLGVIAVAAASVPWLLAWRAARRDEQLRVQAEVSIHELYDEIQRSRYGYGDYAFRADGESRFAIARCRAEEIQQVLRLRFAYLTRCRDDGVEPLPGAGWVELGEHAAGHIKALKNAAYWCVQGIGCVNPDLLDLNWKAPDGIHPGGLQALRAVSLERKVVPMSDFETLRRHRKRRKGALAPVVDLASRAGGESL